MRIDLDTCRDPDLLAAEVRRLQGVIAAAEATLTDEDREAVHYMLRHAAWAAANGAFADSADYRIHHDTVSRIAGRR
jgi:Arc/MetJ family transcription regulator